MPSPRFKGSVFFRATSFLVSLLFTGYLYMSTNRIACTGSTQYGFKFADSRDNGSNNLGI